MSHFQDVDTRNSDSDEDGITIAGPDHFHSRRWHTDLHRIPRQVFRQLFGYKPFKTSYFALYRPLDDYQSRAILGLAVLLSIAAGIPLPLVGVLFSHAINDFPPPEDQLEVILKQLLGVAVAYFVVTWGWSICWGIVGERVARRTREALMKKALAMGVSDLETHAPDVSSMITSGTQTIQSGTSEKVGLFIQSISYFVAAFVVGFIISAKLTGILFAAVIPIMAVTVTCGTMAVSRFSRRASKTLEAAASVAEGAISAVKTVQAFGAGEALAEKHLKILKAAEVVGSKKAFAGGIMLGCVFFIAYAANALAFKIGSQIAGHGGAGSVYAVVFLILDASFVLGQVGPFIQTLALAASAGSTILDFLNLPTPDININASEGITIDAEAWTGNLELRDVTFAYPSRKNVTILDNVSLSFKVGTTTGLVGLSGSGKSTIASLLLRFYDPDMGLITLDGLEIKQADLKSWRANIALVDQEPVLATGTILENIASGLLDETSLSKEDILARCITAAKRANAYFVFDLPQGIYTRVGPSGNTSLSGGQKQRICLARAIVRNPALLILDEPTSALDTTSEKLILQSLQDLQSTGCSIIMIAHRLATIKDMDNIVVFGGGRVLEQGAHQTLIELSGAYKGLVEAQSLECTEEEMSQESVKPDAPDAKLEHKLKDPSAMPSDVETDSTWSDVTVAVGEDNLIQNSQPTWRLVKRCLSLSRPEALFLVAGCIASGMSGSLIVGESIVFGNLVGLLNVQSNESDYGSQVSKFCLIFFALSLIALFAYTTSTTFFGVSSERLVRRVRDRSLRTILRQDIAWFANPKNSTHALTAKMNTDCSHLNGLSGPIIGAVASVSVSIIGGIVLAFIIAWKIAIVLLSVVPVMVLSGFTRLRVLSKSEKRLETAYTEAAVVASEACSQMRTVTAYGREAAIFQKFRSALEKPYKQSYKFNAVTNFFLAFSLAITYFAYTLAYWWGAKLVREGTYTQQQFFIVLPALLFSAQAAGQVFSVAPELARAKSAAQSIFSLFDQRPSILKDDLEAKSIDSSSTGISNEKALSGSIKFDSVTFGYGNDPTELVLKNVSCEIQAGEFVGVVGPSGAGKSSFISLLERFYDPTDGSIILNGRNIRQVPVLEYRSTLGLVSQEPDLFAGSISFNISLGAKPGHEVTQEEIEAVCKRIGLHEFIVSLPTGYNTECGVNGSKLSGGQKQRVAIARALIRKPDVLLLDEATAALDAHSEQQVQEAVAASIGARQTTVVVAHRLSTVRKADRIFVMDRGEIVGVGSHAELVQSNALYRELVHVQEIG